MAKQAKEKEVVNIPSGGPLPGEGEDPANEVRTEITQPVASPVASPAPAAKVPSFKPVPLADSPYQRGFQQFKEVGDTFVGWFVRAISRNDADAVGKYDALEFERYPDGTSTLLPGTQQNWEFFNDVVAEDAQRSRHLFSVTLIEKVMKKDNPEEVHFFRFAYGEDANILRPGSEA